MNQPPFQALGKIPDSTELFSFFFCLLVWRQNGRESSYKQVVTVSKKVNVGRYLLDPPAGQCWGRSWCSWSKRFWFISSQDEQWWWPCWPRLIARWKLPVQRHYPEEHYQFSYRGGKPWLGGAVQCGSRKVLFSEAYSNDIIFIWTPWTLSVLDLTFLMREEKIQTPRTCIVGIRFGIPFVPHTMTRTLLHWSMQRISLETQYWRGTRVQKQGWMTYQGNKYLQLPLRGIN